MTETVAFRLRGLHGGAQVLDEGAFRDGTHKPLDLDLGFSDLLLQFLDRRPVPSAGGLCLLPSLLHTLHELLQEPIGAEERLEFVQHRLLGSRRVDRHHAVADHISAVLASAAGIRVLPAEGEAPAALATDQQPAEQSAVSPVGRGSRSHSRLLLLAGFHGLPHFVGHDPQMRRVDFHPFLFRQFAPDLLPILLGVLRPRAPIPDQPPVVLAVVEDSRSDPPIPHNRGVGPGKLAEAVAVPPPRTRWRDSFGVQQCGDTTGAHAVSVQDEDAEDDGRLFLVDDILVADDRAGAWRVPGLVRVHRASPVAIDGSSRVVTRKYAALQASATAMGVGLDLGLIRIALHGDDGLRRLRRGQRVQSLQE